MRFTEKQLNTFIALYKEEFGEDLTREQAHQEASDLITFLKIVYCTPVKKETYEKYLALKKQ